MSAIAWPRSWATVLGDRRIIRLVGAAAIPLLNGLVTSNVTKLRPGDSQATVFLSAQGRVAADALLVLAGDSLLIDCHREDVNFLMRHIQTYKLRAKFDIKYHDSERVMWSSHKSQAEAISKALGHSAVAVADPRSTSPESIGASGLGWRLFHLPSVTGNLCLSSSDDIAAEAARALGLLLPPCKEYSSHEIGNSIYSTSRRLQSVFEGPNEIMRGSAFPLECNFDTSGAVAFDKGCYVGQELTARTKFRGEVRKRLFALERVGIHAQLLKCFNGESALEQTEPITRGCPLYIAGSSIEVGRVVSEPISPPLFASHVALLRVAEVAAAAGASDFYPRDSNLGSVHVAPLPDSPHFLQISDVPRSSIMQPSLRVILPPQLLEWKSAPSEKAQ